MDYLSIIKQPIASDLSDFIALFEQAMSHEDGMLGSALSHIRQRGGKRMRPILMLLMAKNYGAVSQVTQHSAVGLELLHTASLVHDDVVDESGERRGQASVNATYNNKVAVLVGDYILSTALLHVSFTGNQSIVQELSELGRTLAAGEILQLSNIQNTEISEDVYYDVIKMKTAALFESCAAIGALSAGAHKDEVEKARLFGQNLGIIFQIRDDIFDYYESKEIGKPTGNDMREGTLTLPVIHVINKTQDKEMTDIARRVHRGEVSQEEIDNLVAFTREKGGLDYAEWAMDEFRMMAAGLIDEGAQAEVAEALHLYVDYVAQRNL